MQCTAAYLSPPRATLAFAVDGVRRQISFPLPLPINRFCDPVVLQPAAFVRLPPHDPPGASIPVSLPRLILSTGVFGSP